MPLVSQENDLDLRNRVSRYLAEKNKNSLKDLRIDAAGGVVKMSGTVRSFYEKQLCQQVCRRVAGVIKLIDNVAVAERNSEAVAN
jgi:osmotically-inducible protein OsmY